MGGSEVVALDELDLQIPAGEFVTIMGPSGSGKSTLMHLLGCLDRPTAGRYVLDGVEVQALQDLELSRLRNQKVGFVFQSFNLIAQLSVSENVQLPLVYAGVRPPERRRRAQELLDAVGLCQRQAHRPNELSGGERQRVAIARALANRPKLLLADEPTGNLDSKTGLGIMKLFEELHQDGTTLVLVTHDPGVAEWSDRVVRMLDGRVESDTSVRLREAGASSGEWREVG
ncbi:MAG: ABC transporter ATP-binding protein [Candidatus Latescibacterota bacterium]|nr:MAG: ABC transporter ATP-binding protein [Candidatus Latescibacterota bacterium]